VATDPPKHSRSNARVPPHVAYAAQTLHFEGRAPTPLALRIAVWINLLETEPCRIAMAV
jgi:hypothetical protein